MYMYLKTFNRCIKSTTCPRPVSLNCCSSAELKLPEIYIIQFTYTSILCMYMYTYIYIYIYIYTYI